MNAKNVLSFFQRHLKIFFPLNLKALRQACQTQTTSRAANALKTDKGATKVLKSPLCGPYFTKSND